MRISKFTALLFLLTACSTIRVPEDFRYSEIQTATFKLASWQKITNPALPYKIYIEGDGHAFRANGQPTSDPTPRGTLVRQLAFGDSSPNVVYLARPCQFVEDSFCVERHWTTARFAPEVIRAERTAVESLVGSSEVTLTGFSGGAQVAGLVAVTSPKLRVRKIVTVAGNLDHEEWTAYHHLPALSESMNLGAYRNAFRRFEQVHYVGEKDTVVPPILVRRFVGDDSKIREIPNAKHDSGWKNTYLEIRAE